MELESILIAVHVVAAIAITGLVLIQRGKGADIGASFGSGASQTMFGSMGSGNFLTRSTTLLTVVFFATSLGLAIVASQRAELAVQQDSLLSGDIEMINQESNAGAQQAPAAEQAPAGDLPAAPGAEVSGADDLPAVEGAAGTNAQPVDAGEDAQSPTGEPVVEDTTE